MTVSRVVRKVLTNFELGCEIKSDLLKSGFVPKAEKCVWESLFSVWKF